MGDIEWKTEIDGVSVGKERYKLFKKDIRYYIQVGNVTNYYYSEYIFWKKFFEVCEEHEFNSLEKFMLGTSIGK